MERRHFLALAATAPVVTEIPPPQVSMGCSVLQGASGVNPCLDYLPRGELNIIAVSWVKDPIDPNCRIVTDLTTGNTRRTLNRMNS